MISKFKSSMTKDDVRGNNTRVWTHLMHGKILLQWRELCNAIIISTVLLGAGFLAKCAICVNHARTFSRKISRNWIFSLETRILSLVSSLRNELDFFSCNLASKNWKKIWRIRVWGEGGMVEPRSETDVQLLLGCLKRGLAQRSPPSGMCHDFSPLCLLLLRFSVIFFYAKMK
jgi:hypothetical protein